jgi:type II secretory pathway component PulF
MRLYLYTAVSRTGDRLAGEMESATRETVLEHLHALGHLPVKVVEATNADTRRAQNGAGLLARKPSSAQLTLFTHELAMLLRAGLPLDRSLSLLERDAGSRSLSRLISRVGSQISEGRSLHAAMAAQEDVFPPFYTSMVRVAEASGTLDTVLERIAQARTRIEKLRGKALSAVLYPSLLIVIAIAAVMIMLAFVVPRFKQMIVHAGAEVPDSARIVIASSDWLLLHGHALAIGVLAVVGVTVLLWRRSETRQLLESMLFRLPVVGNLLRLNLTIRFCRTLGLLLENGVDLPVAMTLIRDVIGNRLASGIMTEAHEALRKGRSFLDPIAAADLFPPVVINMLRVGEETGGLAASALHMADMFEDKLETALQRTFTIFEPVIIVLVSLFIAGIIISILGAVISINDLVL